MSRFAFAFITFLLFTLTCNGQNFKIQSIDGFARKINLAHEVGDGKLAISCLGDTITIEDFIGISQKVIVLQKCFLAVNYEIRSGSDQNDERILLFYVNKNRLCVAANLTSLAISDLNTDQMDYQLNISLTGTDQSNYTLQINEHDKSSSQHSPATHQKTILRFDKDQRIFYNTRQKLSRYFTIYDRTNPKVIKQYVSGIFPVIQLRRFKYYFIHGQWYEEGFNDSLIKCAHR